MDALIRAPRVEDAEQIGPLHNALWRSTYAGLMSADYLAARSDVEATRRWAETLGAYDVEGHTPAGGVTRVADDNGKVVGFATSGPARDIDAQAEHELWGLYVAQDLHRSGVGTALLTAVLPPGPAYLWVLLGNAGATGFYEHHGFARTGRMKTHPPTGAVELEMVRATAPPRPS